MSTPALLCLLTGATCLKIIPDDRELVLVQGSTLTLTCSGLGETRWEFKKDDVPNFQVDQEQKVGKWYEVVQNGNKSSDLTLLNVSWQHTGVYLCTDQVSGESKEVTVFVPGEKSLIISALLSGPSCSNYLYVSFP